MRTFDEFSLVDMEVALLVISLILIKRAQDSMVYKTNIHLYLSSNSNTDRVYLHEARLKLLSSL